MSKIPLQSRSSPAHYGLVPLILALAPLILALVPLISGLARPYFDIFYFLLKNIKNDDLL
jgi:hypothetical protein